MNLYGSTKLSLRQMQVAGLVAEGLKNKEIAPLLGTTEHVIKNHLRTIYDRLGFWNRVELSLWYEKRKHEGADANS